MYILSSRDFTEFAGAALPIAVGHDVAALWRRAEKYLSDNRLNSRWINEQLDVFGAGWKTTVFLKFKVEPIEEVVR